MMLPANKYSLMQAISYLHKYSLMQAISYLQFYITHNA